MYLNKVGIIIKLTDVIHYTMSSHHIVREKQEPALLIIDLDHFNTELLGQLLEWSPTVLVTDTSYEKVNAMGIKIDAIFTTKVSCSIQAHTRIIPCTDNQLADALKYLVAEQYPAVNIIDHSFCLKDYALFADLINLVVFVGNQKIFPIRSGFSKWQVAKQNISLMHEASNVHTFGLLPTSNTMFKTEKDGFYGLTFDQPFVFMSERID